MEDDIKIIHFGASIIGRYLFGQKKEHGVYINLGLGWNFYENKYTFINLNHIKAKTYAISGYLGYDYKIFKNIAIGIGLDYKLASFSEATINGIDRELDDNQFENISRQSIMIGIRYVR